MSCGTKRIWRYKPPDSQVNVTWWGPDAGPHLDPLQWSGPIHAPTGFPLPSVVPPIVNTTTISTTNVNDNNSGAIQARYGFIWYWAWLPDDVTHWRDNNANTGELGMVLAGDCCGGPLVEQPGGNHTANTSAADRTLMDSNPVTGGWKFIVMPQSDLGAFGGLDLEYSTNNEVSWQNVRVFQSNKPEIEGMNISSCQELTEEDMAAGWSCDPLQHCCKPFYLGGAISANESNGGDTDDGFALCDDYEIRDLRESGFFPPQDAMNAQLQVFNSGTVPGSTSWQLRITSNYSITSMTPSAGFTIGTVQTVDNGTTYDHIIPVTGSIPGNNGNMQVSITGNIHPQSVDTVASHTDKELFCS